MKITRNLIKFMNIANDYGSFIALKLFFYKIFNKDNYDNTVKRLLVDENEGVLKKYSSVTHKHNDTNSPSPIWVCWWQGYDNMPQLVLRCYESILANCGYRNVNLITKDNYYEFVEIPDYIIEKLNSGYISITHFSDILRVSLLRKYGGCWIDATIYVSSQIPEEVFSCPVYTRKLSSSKVYDGKNVSKGRWSVYLLAGHKECLLFSWLEEFFFNYWKIHNTTLDYFLMDYAIIIGVEKIPSIERLIANVPVNNSQVHALQKRLNNEFVEHDFIQLCSDTVFHKLNWRLNYLSFDSDKKTYFGKIFDSNDRFVEQAQ